MRESDLEIGALLQAPKGRVFNTNGGRFKVTDYDIYSGKYTLAEVGGHEVVERRRRDIMEHWVTV